MVACHESVPHHAVNCLALVATMSEYSSCTQAKSGLLLTSADLELKAGPVMLSY